MEEFGNFRTPLIDIVHQFATIENRGTFRVQTDARLEQLNGGLDFINSGTFVKEPNPDDREQGIGDTYFSVETFVNTGTIDIKTGRIVHGTRFSDSPGIIQAEGGVTELSGGHLLSSRTFQLEGGTGDLFKWSTGKPWALRKEL